jgi:hypothetical protein
LCRSGSALQITMPQDYRIAMGITHASRALRSFPKPKPSNPAAKLGLRYERNVGKELTLHVNRGNFINIEHNPWFTFHDDYGVANCCPDFLLRLDQGIVVVEVKLTWVEVAMAKLEELYCPVIRTALRMPTRPLVICRNMSRLAPPPQFTLREAMSSPHRLLQWPSTGHIQW